MSINKSLQFFYLIFFSLKSMLTNSFEFCIGRQYLVINFITTVDI